MTAPPMTLPSPPAAAALAAAAAPLPPQALLAAVLGGGMIDAVHSGSVGVVDLAGRLQHAAGNPWSVVPTRSTMKPFQAGLDQLGLLDDAQRAELADGREPAVRNTRGIVTGTIRSLVVLYKLPAEAATIGRGAGSPGSA